MRKAGIHRQQVEATLHFLLHDLIDDTFIYQNRLPKVCKTTAHRVEIKSPLASCSNMDAACPPQAYTISISFILACPRIA
jgi:hypothetical protein